MLSFAQNTLKNKQMPSTLQVVQGCLSSFAAGSFIVITGNRYMGAYSKGQS